MNKEAILYPTMNRNLYGVQLCSVQLLKRQQYLTTPQSNFNLLKSALVAVFHSGQRFFSSPTAAGCRYAHCAGSYYKIKKLTLLVASLLISNAIGANMPMQPGAAFEPVGTWSAVVARQVANEEECRAGQTVQSGEICVYPGTDLEFTVLASGSGRLGFFTAGQGLNIVDSVINGQRITFVANRQGDGSWLIERVGDSVSGNVPDLVVGSPTVSDASPDAGASFTLRATVRNGGDGQSAATTLRYYRSLDATISTSDMAVGSDTVNALAASGTSAESVSLTAPSIAGTYYYGACVDTVSGESNTANNCSSGVRVNVSASGGGGNSFSVGQAVTGIPTSGFWFPAVVNTGAGASYQSRGGTVTLRWSNNRSAAGIEYQGRRYTCETSGGCEVVDGVVTRGTVRVSGGGGTPPPPSTSPDLVVGSPTVSDASPDAGASFTLRATVRNGGDGQSAATTLRYYRSLDATISTSDMAVGSDTVNALAASGTSAESVSLTAPSIAGTYYYGACVDTVSGESNTANNCSSGVRVNVSASGGGGNSFSVGQAVTGIPTSGFWFPAVVNTGAGASYQSRGGTVTLRWSNNRSAAGIEYQGRRYTCETSGGCEVVDGVVTRGTVRVSGGGGTPPPPSTSPDLVVGSPTVSDASPDAGASFTLRATVRNGGDGQSAATTLRYYRSLDATISTSDMAVGSDTVNALAASGTSAESVSLTAPSIAGTYYYGACVDTVSGESNTANNCSSGVRVNVSASGGGGNSFSVGQAVTGIPTSGFWVPAVVNTGAGASYQSRGGTVTLRWSNNRSAAGIEYQGRRYTCETSGGCEVVDGVVTRGTVRVSGGGGTPPPPSTSPDLVVGSPTVSDASPDAGASFTLRATVRNGGDGQSAATTLRYYRSLDATISTSDMAVGSDTVNALAASGTSAESVSLTAPSIAGTYYYGACVDTVSGESNTANNCSSGVRVNVSASGGGGNSFSVGQAVTGIPTSGFWVPAVVNTGAGASYQSRGGTVTLRWSNNRSAAGIEYQGRRYTCETSGGCEVVDGVVTRGTVRVSGGGGTPPPPSTSPDLVVGSPTVSDASPDAGASFTLRATVRNGGDGQSAATTLRYYRSLDATISTSDMAVGSDTVNALAASGTSAESVSLTAPSIAGTYYYGACVDTVSGESNTANNCSSGVRVTVSSGAGNVPEPSPPRLESLSLSAGVLKPSFSSETMRYTTVVGSEVERITLNPIANDTDHNIAIAANGNSIVGDIVSLNVGDNTIVITITTADRQANASYTIQLTRLSPPRLESLSLSAGILNPNFSSEIMRYTAVVGSEVERITLNPIAEDTNHSIAIAANGNSIVGNTVPLNVGDNTIVITVTTADRQANASYTIQLTRLSPPRLASLSLSAGILKPNFSSEIMRYTAVVGSEVERITLNPIAEDTNHSIAIAANGNSIVGNTVPLNVGDNTIVITVTTADRQETVRYSIEMTRSAPCLTDLSLSTGLISPNFIRREGGCIAATVSYKAIVGNDVSQVSVTAVADSNAHTIAINGNQRILILVDLNVGDNTVAIEVVSADGTGMRNYNLIIRRLSTATLMGVTATAQTDSTELTLVPAFSPNILNYRLSINSTVTGISLTPVAAAGRNIAIRYTPRNATAIKQSVASNDTITIAPLSDSVNIIYIDVMHNDAMEQYAFTVHSGILVRTKVFLEGTI